MSTNFGSFGLPNAGTPVGIAAKEGGPIRMANEWFRWVTRISQLSAERPIATIALGASPYTYEATTIGHLSVEGGTVSAKLLTRGDSSVTISGGLIPMAAGDTLRITYTVAPTVKFIPSARA